MYNVLLEHGAEKDLRRLPQDVNERVVALLKKLQHVPRPSSVRKLVGSKNDWRLRVGDYRIVYAINDKNQEIQIMKIKHRREVYRN